MKILVDENVSLSLSSRLKALGHEAEHISEIASKGIPDEKVWELARDGPRLLVTRDFHFANQYRFDSTMVLGILYIRIGNLKIEEEIALVEHFLKNHTFEQYKGRLVTLSQEQTKIR